jgi:hypothetical protein
VSEIQKKSLFFFLFPSQLPDRLPDFLFVVNRVAAAGKVEGILVARAGTEYALMLQVYYLNRGFDILLFHIRIIFFVNTNLSNLTNLWLCLTGFLIRQIREIRVR